MRGVYDYTIYRAMRVGRRLLAFAIALFLIVSFSGDAIAAEIKADAENAIRLTGGTGTITVTDSRGRKSQVSTKMRLENGSLVTTSAKSSATVKLDNTKYIKLDSLTKAEVRRAGDKTEVLLNAGSLFFNVTSSLEDSEIFNIRTSGMVMAVRGTCGQVEILDPRHTRVSLLEGSLHCKVTNLKSGDSKTVILLAGQAADFYLTKDGSDDCKIVTEDIGTDSIKGFILEELLNDKNLANKVFQQSGLDFRNLTSSMVDSRMKKDQNVAKNTKDKAKKNSKKAIEMDFLEEHNEGRIFYTTEGLVSIVPENVSEEQIAGNGSAGSSDQNNSEGSDNRRPHTRIKEISGRTVPFSPDYDRYNRKIPSPTAVVVFNDYSNGL
ncbi:FecR family protein [Butyrivibrio sp. VCD2006]|uniref:FecR family protein n=1 Tax=Butyrivibrio sp. VCD2006 TaxID=1280664 RepID=UPI00041BCC55|nr:FecR family protein [Butyrivibrio sp. VCD2006]